MQIVAFEIQNTQKLTTITLKEEICVTFLVVGRWPNNFLCKKNPYHLFILQFTTKSDILGFFQQNKLFWMSQCLDM